MENKSLLLLLLLLLFLLPPPFPLEEQISSSSSSSSSFLLELCPFVIRNRSWNFWQFAERQTSYPFFFAAATNLNPTPNQTQKKKNNNPSQFFCHFKSLKLKIFNKEKMAFLQGRRC
jgi:hypothetical protein